MKLIDAVEARGTHSWTKHPVRRRKPRRGIPGGLCEAHRTPTPCGGREFETGGVPSYDARASSGAEERTAIIDYSFVQVATEAVAATTERQDAKAERIRQNQDPTASR